MTDKQSTVVVSRELAEVLMNTTASSMARAELFALLAATPEQTVDVDEPAAYVDSSCLRNLKMSGFESYSALLHSAQADMLSHQRIALYRHAQPPAKVMLPGRLTKTERSSDEYDAHADSWNACLDKVARLNGIKP